MDKQSTKMALAVLERRGKFGIDNLDPPITRVYGGKYGLSKEILQAALKKLNGHCFICGEKKYLVLDHNHKTKKARGYICKKCNTRLAGLDDEQFRAKALAYLDNPPLQQFYEK